MGNPLDERPTGAFGTVPEPEDIKPFEKIETPKPEKPKKKLSWLTMMAALIYSPNYAENKPEKLPETDAHKRYRLKRRAKNRRVKAARRANRR